jgi:hypothetical protein
MDAARALSGLYLEVVVAVLIAGDREKRLKSPLRTQELIVDRALGLPGPDVQNKATLEQLYSSWPQVSTSCGLGSVTCRKCI